MAALKLLTAAALIRLVIAAPPNITIWSSVVITTFGDRVPLLSPDYSVLTPYGAQQLANQGAFFRNRYISSTDSQTAIAGISPLELDNTQTTFESTSDIAIQQSAQAFIAALYPPLPASYVNKTVSVLSNGSTATGPANQNGQSYPNIYTSSPLDAQSIYLAGQAQCPSFASALSTAYTSTPWFQAQEAETASFYNNLNATNGPFASAIAGSSVSLANAYRVYDFLSYERLHNGTVVSMTKSSDLDQAFYLSNQYLSNALGLNASLRATYADQNAAMLTIAGRTLAAQILSLFYQSMGTNATQLKLNTNFAGFEPIMSFAGLMNWGSNFPEFLGMPAPGASLVAELFSDSSSASSSSGSSSGGLPSADALQVRMFFRNGTDPSTPLVAYPATTEKGGSTQGVSFAQFAGSLTQFAIAEVAQWCNMCGAGNSSVFCAFYQNNEPSAGGGSTGSSGSGSSSGTTSTNCHPGQVSPVVGGVIGAVVTLGTLFLAALIAALCAGCRLRRDGRSVLAKRGRARAGGARSLGGPSISGPIKRRADLGGFKGSEKLASDVDLPRGAAGMGASVVPVEGAAGGQAHRRVESWELREGRGGAGAGAGGMDRGEEPDLAAMKAIEARESV